VTTGSSFSRREREVVKLMSVW